MFFKILPSIGVESDFVWLYIWRNSATVRQKDIGLVTSINEAATAYKEDGGGCLNKRPPPHTRQLLAVGTSGRFS